MWNLISRIFRCLEADELLRWFPRVKMREFKQIYRKVSVDHLDEKKIEEYLQKHGIDAMKDLAPKKIGVGQLKRKTPKRRQNHKVQNQHLEGVLEDYE
ncbi:hypothetical protein ANCDUO_07221 [Ancylostoma duodenale]|uniref:Uncharacterized protein n=1 Tax=Ancylostoma duodenale TaxID=51022 RepID=A0A0C2GZE2_9BILA|nr:hypothetical protein ANCDUO_07221 [Ancylostoma duodenale]